MEGIYLFIMKLPETIENLIEEEIKKYKLSNLKEYAKNLSAKYLNEERTGKVLLSKDEEAMVYSIIRMPATFCAVSKALEQTLENYDEKIESVLDVGAGLGAATWAIKEKVNCSNFTCLEREDAMRKLGQKFMKENIDANWVNSDIVKDEISGRYDLVVTSYMINELSLDNRLEVIKKLLNVTNKILLIVEPGTPDGFKNIKEIREYAINNGLFIMAPCIGNSKCMLEENDWCNSYCRVERTKVHKLLKDGELPYEDEKFSYIAISKNEVLNPKARILRHPIIQSKMVRVKLCTKDGIKETIITKKNAEIYKALKKKTSGDSLNFD